MAAATAIVLALAACTRPAESAAPPGLAPGARLADIRMFEFDRQSRVTLVEGTVLALRWPWVEVGAGNSPGPVRYWVNFNHVCSFRLEDQDHGR